MQSPLSPPTAPAPAGGAAPDGPLAFGPFVLDAGQAWLRREGAVVALTGRPFEVLALLARHAGRLLSKDEVLDAIWGHRHVSESVLKTAVNTLRLALGDDARAPVYVETVPRRGYRFIATVQPWQPPAPQPAPASAAAAAAGPLAASPFAASPLPASSPQAPAPGVAAQATDAAAVPPVARSGNLPAAGEPLLGRDAVLAQLLALMDQHRLVTLTGLGGVGKTRLALAAAAATPPPADGAWLLRLDDLADPALLLPTLATLLQLGTGAGSQPQALARALAGQRLLLVLDNAEHLVAAVAELAAALLAGAPGVQLLVTSQLPLRLGAEQVLPLSPLDLPADLADAAPAPHSYAAAQLLCARVAQQRPGWQPGPADAADIATICRTLDGVPLALELAAARVPLLGLAGVRARLNERFALLTRGARDAAARHRTLAAALDWTFTLLAPAERQALQRLALFAGSFGVDDAEGVLAGLEGIEPLEVIDELGARSLLVQVSGIDGAPRLRLYDSVRRHAAAGLQASGDEADARARLLQWLLQRLQGLLHTDLFTPMQQWLPALRADVDSLRGALQHALAAEAPLPLFAQGALLLARSMPLWHRGGYRNEARRWMLQVQARLAAEGAGLAPALHWWCDLAFGYLGTLGQQLPPTDTHAAIGRALAGQPAHGDAATAYLLHYLAFHSTTRVAPPADASLVQQVARALQPAWPPFAQRHLLNVQGIDARIRGDMAQYRNAGRRQAEVCLQAGAHFESVVGRAMEGQALLLMGQLDAACSTYAAAVQTLRALGLLREQVPTLAMAAALHLQRRLDAASRALALDALRLLAAEGMVWWMADALAWAAWHDGRAGDAARLLAWADRLVAARQEQRGPIFQGMRDGMQAALGAQAAAPPAPLPAGDAEAIDLALGPGTAALVLAGTTPAAAG